MTLKICFAAFLLLHLHLMAASKKTLPAFKTRHINSDMKPDQCSDVIQQKHVNSGGPIRKVNTFIQTKVEKVIAVCAGRTGIFESDTNFRVVVCCLVDGNTESPLKYIGYHRFQTIRVECNKAGHPVHYARQDPCPPAPPPKTDRF